MAFDVLVQARGGFSGTVCSKQMKSCHCVMIFIALSVLHAIPLLRQQFGALEPKHASRLETDAIDVHLE